MTSDRLTAAIEEHHRENPPRPFIRATGATGELAVAQAPEEGTRRVVLITERDESIRAVHILLASNVVDMATDLDAIIDRDDSGAPFDLLVQSELYGPIFTEQLDDLVGALDQAVVDALSHAVATDGESLVGIEVGLPLGGSDDPRRRFKESELDDLMRLVASCRRWIAGGRADATSIDPEVLFPPPSGTSFDEGLEKLDELLGILDQYEQEGNHLSVDLSALFDDTAFAELRRWHTEFGVDILARLLRVTPDANGTSPTEPANREELRMAFLAVHAESGTLAVDLVTSLTHATALPLVVSAPGDPTRFSRGRTVLVGERE